jgi:hypothetical protein
MDVSEARRLQATEGENVKLKKLLSQHICSMRQRFRSCCQKMVRPVAKRAGVANLKAVGGLV